MNPARQTVELVDAIDEWLPQAQCARCGYPRCLDYARAAANGDADIDQCPPGGDVTIRGLAELLGRPPKPLNIAYGVQRPKTRVRIDESRCIGCTLCTEACPVDAIVGAAKQMHSVIEVECTGCELCLPACPIDCIDVLPASAPEEPDNSPWPEYSLEQVERARCRSRLKRLNRQEQERRLEIMHKKARSGKGRHRIKNEIAAAVSRARARRQHSHHIDHE
ncbi:MAG: Electron transport complex subunit RsxB [Gammaproteobacteria bacterium]|nr:Electron transport complex subunit RsxB [Gammaproteobacteria bacterium]